MPETPDFDQIARVLLTRVALHARPHGFEEEVTTVAEQLRQVWNARGAADVERLEVELSEMIATKTTHERLDQALRSLDQ